MHQLHYLQPEMPYEHRCNGNVKIKEMNDIECILCGNCIDNCKQKVISFSFKIR